MSGVVIYRTSTGSTLDYAKWIAEATGFTAYESKDAGIPWSEVDTIVIGCPIIASSQRSPAGSRRTGIG